MKKGLIFLRIAEIINFLSWILLFVFILAFYTGKNQVSAYKDLQNLRFIGIFLVLALISMFIVIKIKGKFPSLDEEGY